MTAHNVQESQKVRLLTFRVAHLHCAMYAEFVREIIPMPATMKIPGQPSILEGFLEFRGAILPIIRLAALFGFVFTPAVWSHVIVTRISGSEIGLLVDGVDDLLTVASGELRPLAADRSVNECADTGFTAADRDYIVLDANCLLLAEEKACLTELGNQVRLRRASVGKVEL